MPFWRGEYWTGNQKGGLRCDGLSCSVMSSSATLWALACQASLSMELSRQEYWSGSLFPPPGDLPDPGIEPESLVSPTLGGGFLTTATRGIRQAGCQPERHPSGLSQVLKLPFPEPQDWFILRLCTSDTCLILLPVLIRTSEFKQGSLRKALPWWLRDKESACQCRRCRFDLWVGKIPWRRKWQPTPVSLPGTCHGQRCLAGYSPRVAGLDMT